MKIKHQSNLLEFLVLISVAVLMLIKDIGAKCMLAKNLYVGVKYVGETVCP